MFCYCILPTAQFPREHLLKSSNKDIREERKIRIERKIGISQTESNKWNDRIVTR